jgi:hypothetical protein
MILDDGSRYDTGELGLLDLFDPFPFDFLVWVTGGDLVFEGGGVGFSAHAVQFGDVSGCCSRCKGGSKSGRERREGEEGIREYGDEMFGEGFEKGWVPREGGVHFFVHC